MEGEEREKTPGWFPGFWLSTYRANLPLPYVAKTQEVGPESREGREEFDHDR
jgi:hypothetical protein